MELINHIDLITSGIGFSIVNEDSDFAEDGELTSCRTIIDKEYGSYDSSPAEENEVLYDINSLRDDNDRWGHLRDTHIAEALAEAHTLSMPISGRLYGEMQYHQLRRERKTAELLGYIAKLRIKRSTNRILRKLISGVWQRYRDSVKLIVQRNKQEWWLLYLTREQTDTVINAAKRAMT